MWHLRWNAEASLFSVLSHGSCTISGAFFYYFLFTFCWPLFTISFSWTRKRQDSQGDTVVLCIFIPVILVGKLDWLPNQSCDLTFLCWTLGKKFVVVRRTHLELIGGVIPVSPDKGSWRLLCRSRVTEDGKFASWSELTPPLHFALWCLHSPSWEYVPTKRSLAFGV